MLDEIKNSFADFLYKNVNAFEVDYDNWKVKKYPALISTKVGIIGIMLCYLLGLIFYYLNNPEFFSLNSYKFYSDFLIHSLLHPTHYISGGNQNQDIFLAFFQFIMSIYYLIMIVFLLSKIYNSLTSKKEEFQLHTLVEKTDYFNTFSLNLIDKITLILCCYPIIYFLIFLTKDFNNSFVFDNFLFLPSVIVLWVILKFINFIFFKYEFKSKLLENLNKNIGTSDEVNFYILKTTIENDLKLINIKTNIIIAVVVFLIPILQLYY